MFDRFVNIPSASQHVPQVVPRIKAIRLQLCRLAELLGCLGEFSKSSVSLARHQISFVILGYPAGILLEVGKCCGIVADFNQRLGERKSSCIVLWVEPENLFVFGLGFLVPDVFRVHGSQTVMCLSRLWIRGDQLAEQIDSLVGISVLIISQT